MASEEFISLGAPCDADDKGEEETSLQTMPPNVNGGGPLASECQLEGEPSTIDNTKALDGIIDLEGQDQVDVAPAPTIDRTNVSRVTIDLEEGQVEDMDLLDDDIVVAKHQHLDASIQTGASVAAVHTLNGVSVELDKSNGLENVSQESIKEQSSPVTAKTKSLLVLIRESKRKLMELMQQWSEWHSRKQHTFMVLFFANMASRISNYTVEKLRMPFPPKSGEEVLECGEETYYPALHVGLEKSCAVESGATL
uniref:Uncharacterized protein n=1 Tax=Leersia perrieri TaxID=77586 RepID=A0A0D9WPZ7_9ORYZ